MSLTLYCHPLASYCHKALIALYENDTPFTPQLIDLGNEQSRQMLLNVWPIGKFPVLRDGERIVPESTIIIEYLAQHYPGAVKLVPDDPDAAREVRARDRFFDWYVQDRMQTVTGNRLRPADKRDPYGVERAVAGLHTALGMLEKDMASRPWATGDAFTLADCSAAPALFFVNDAVLPLAGPYPNVAAYLGRLKERPSYARVLREAQPYMHLVPR